MTYKYVSPADRGYIRVKIGRGLRKELLPLRKNNIFNKQEWWISKGAVEIHYLTSLLGKVLCILLFPVNGLIHGFFNKELYSEYNKMFQEKKYGSFSSDKVLASRNSLFYNTVLSSLTFKQIVNLENLEK